MPVYTYRNDPKARSLIGSDETGWRNVYTQTRPAAPGDFTQQETHAGLVLADAQGKTIYIYSCGDDALDQLACDHPDSPQEYRLAVCGGGDADRCLRTWPYVLASARAVSPSPVWTVMTIDPRSGRTAAEGQAGAVRVWAYRARPVYTYANDQPGDVKGDALGEYYGSRNGFKAFWIRDDFFNNAG
jgi:predicted lipoprotein with Yx(FWY)xxD motif